MQIQFFLLFLQPVSWGGIFCLQIYATMKRKTENINSMKRLFIFLFCGLLCVTTGCKKKSSVVADGVAGNLKWSLNENGTLTISGTGAMLDYSFWGVSLRSTVPWNEYQGYITDVVIGDGVNKIGSCAFMNCDSLTSVTISNSVTSIGDRAFYECVSLPSIVIPNSVTAIGNSAFSGCSGLTSVAIGNSVTVIGEGAFSGCSGLKSVAIPNSVTSIGNYAFFGCSGLTSVAIGNSVTVIGEGAFSGCSGLKSVTIPNSVTSIGNQAFQNCTGLTSITIPNSVTVVGYGAFTWCSGLTEIINESVIPQEVQESVFVGINVSACTLRVPTASVAAYRAATGWKDFVNIFAIQ